MHNEMRTLNGGLLSIVQQLLNIVQSYKDELSKDEDCIEYSSIVQGCNCQRMRTVCIFKHIFMHAYIYIHV